MPQEFPNLTHGDGHLITDSFYAPVSAEETPMYLHTLQSVLQTAGLEMTIKEQDPDLSSTLLALKQRFMIGFSNGCPWPEQAISEYLHDQKIHPENLTQLAKQIIDSARFDGKHNMLFQNMLQYASEPLKKDLLSYHPWEKIKGQEDRNLPKDITDPEGKGAYGLAFGPPYFESLIPLYKFIDSATQPEVHEARYYAVTDFFQKKLGKVESINALVEQTQAFLKEPQKYVEPYVVSHQKV